MLMLYPMLVMDDGSICYQIIDSDGKDIWSGILAVNIDALRYVTNRIKGDIHLLQADDIRIIKAQHKALGLIYEPDTQEFSETATDTQHESEDFQQPETD